LIGGAVLTTIAVVAVTAVVAVCGVAIWIDTLGFDWD
jgi:hypothetical protein